MKSNKLVTENLKKLGFKVKDKVTGLEGVATSICFDLYGCIQAIVNPGIDKDGKIQEVHWYDVNRLNIISDEPVMNQPSFVNDETDDDDDLDIFLDEDIPGPESNKPKFY